MLRSFGSAGILPAFLNLRFAAVLAFLFVQTERQKSRLEAGATKERCRDIGQVADRAGLGVYRAYGAAVWREGPA